MEVCADLSPRCAQCWQFYLLSGCQETPCLASSAQRSSSGKRCSWLPMPCAVEELNGCLRCRRGETSARRGQQRQDRHSPSKARWSAGEKPVGYSNARVGKQQVPPRWASPRQHEASPACFWGQNFPFRLPRAQLQEGCSPLRGEGWLSPQRHRVVRPSSARVPQQQQQGSLIFPFPLEVLHRGISLARSCCS